MVLALEFEICSGSGSGSPPPRCFCVEVTEAGRIEEVPVDDVSPASSVKCRFRVDDPRFLLGSTCFCLITHRGRHAVVAPSTPVPRWLTIARGAPRVGGRPREIRELHRLESKLAGLGLADDFSSILGLQMLLAATDLSVARLFEKIALRGDPLVAPRPRDIFRDVLTRGLSGAGGHFNCSSSRSGSFVSPCPSALQAVESVLVEFPADVLVETREDPSGGGGGEEGDFYSFVRFGPVAFAFDWVYFLKMSPGCWLAEHSSISGTVGKLLWIARGYPIEVAPTEEEWLACTP